MLDCLPAERGLGLSKGFDSNETWLRVGEPLTLHFKSS